MYFIYYYEIHNTKYQIIFMINGTDNFKSLIGEFGNANMFDCNQYKALCKVKYDTPIMYIIQPNHFINFVFRYSYLLIHSIHSYIAKIPKPF